VVEQLPYDHIYRNPNYKAQELRVRDSTEKSRTPHALLITGFRGKLLVVEASIPNNWFKAGETIPIKIELTPAGYKKVFL